MSKEENRGVIMPLALSAYEKQRRRSSSTACGYRSENRGTLKVRTMKKGPKEEEGSKTSRNDEGTKLTQDASARVVSIKMASDHNQEV